MQVPKEKPYIYLEWQTKNKSYFYVIVFSCRVLCVFCSFDLISTRKRKREATRVKITTERFLNASDSTRYFRREGDTFLRYIFIRGLSNIAEPLATAVAQLFPKSSEKFTRQQSRISMRVLQNAVLQDAAFFYVCDRISESFNLQSHDSRLHLHD